MREGDLIEIRIDGESLHGSVDLVGEADEQGITRFSPEEGSRRLAARLLRADLTPHPALPDHTRLWAALIQASGGVWGGCVYDTEAVVKRLSLSAQPDSAPHQEKPA